MCNTRGGKNIATTNRVMLLRVVSNLFFNADEKERERDEIATRRRRETSWIIRGRRFSDNDGVISYLCAHDFRNNIGPRYRNMTPAQRNPGSLPDECSAACRIFDSLRETEIHIYQRGAKNTGSLECTRCY